MLKKKNKEKVEVDFDRNDSRTAFSKDLCGLATHITFIFVFLVSIDNIHTEILHQVIHCSPRASS